MDADSGAKDVIAWSVRGQCAEQKRRTDRDAV